MQRKDITGERFGKLTVMEFAGISKDHRALWKCKCDCGNEVVVIGKNLRNGNTKSCGCLGVEKLIQRSTTHGHAHERLYQVWCSIKTRCNNPNNYYYRFYGAKGIKVCKEWEDYAVFREWAYTNGYKEDAKVGECTIDRIDYTADYEPSNCRWITQREQKWNTRANKIVAYNGKRMCLAQACEEAKLPYDHTYYLMNRYGFSFDEVASIGG